MSMGFKSLETAVVHAGEPEKRIEGAIVMPVFQSSTFEYAGQTQYSDLKYIRLNNTPNHAVLHAKLAALENGEAALVTSSGMAAISGTLLSILGSGDHLLAQPCLYGGTYDLVTKDLPAFGIGLSFLDDSAPEKWKSLLRPTTRAIYVETITNPLMQVIDLREVVNFAREFGLIALIDNTFATPVNFRPLDAGFDLALHSCTKYMNGHTDIVAGAVVGSADLIRRINSRLVHLGGALDPHACFLLHRGIKTLVLRVRQQNASAARVAEFLETQNAVQRVHYPGLSSRGQDRFARQLLKGFGGMLSFELRGGGAAASGFLSRLKLAVEAPSLGGVETLVTRPATTSHTGLTREERAKLGISDGLIRMSVGIESAEDLMDDLQQAFESL